MDKQNKFDLASNSQRYIALIIDNFTISFLIIPFFFFSNRLMIENKSTLLLFYILILNIIFAITFISKDIIKGISLGKMIMGIAVRDEKNHNITPPLYKLMLRNLTLIFWPIEVIMLILSKQRLGDKYAQTAVIKNPVKLKLFNRITTIILLTTIFFSFLLITVTYLIKSSEPYKVSINKIENDTQLINKIGKIKGYGLIPTGGVHTIDGNGNAYFNIEVIGNKSIVHINTQLEKHTNKKWEIIKYNIIEE